MQPPGEEYAGSFFFVTTVLLTEYITYCIYARGPFAKKEKDPAQILDINNKHYFKSIQRPQKVKLNCLETSFRLGDATAWGASSCDFL